MFFRKKQDKPLPEEAKSVPDEKQGCWIFNGYWRGYEKYYCSECGPKNDLAVRPGGKLLLRCPFCDAKMDGGI